MILFIKYFFIILRKAIFKKGLKTFYTDTDNIFNIIFSEMTEK